MDDLDLKIFALLDGPAKKPRCPRALFDRAPSQLSRPGKSKDHELQRPTLALTVSEQSSSPAGPLTSLADQQHFDCDPPGPDADVQSPQTNKNDSSYAPGSSQIHTVDHEFQEIWKKASLTAQLLITIILLIYRPLPISSLIMMISWLASLRATCICSANPRAAEASQLCTSQLRTSQLRTSRSHTGQLSTTHGWQSRVNVPRRQIKKRC